MRIVYEGATFDILPNGGASRYFADVISRLPLNVRPIVLVPSDYAFPAFHPRLRIEQVRTKPPINLFRGIWRRRQHAIIEERIESLSPDVTHWTYYTGLCRRPFQRGAGQTVVTVYDFIHEAFPEQDPSGKNRQWQKQAIEQADHICCISETTFNELCDRYPSAADRASVTVLGNTFSSLRAAPIQSDLASRSFILFVGRREGYKNFETLYRAWRNARSRIKDLSLVLAGPPMKRRERNRLGMTHEVDGLIHLGHVSDRQLKGLYQNCKAFVFPSRMEGFGLPALEAMDSGATIIASNCEALREVAGDAGYYFDAEDVDTLTEQLVAAGSDSLKDCELKRQLGFVRSKNFSWQKTATQTAQVYSHLLHVPPMQRAA